MDFFDVYLEVAPPRSFGPFAPDVPPALLFTDAWQGATTYELTISAVLFIPESEHLAFTAMGVEEATARRWLELRTAILTPAASAPPL